MRENTTEFGAFGHEVDDFVAANDLPSPEDHEPAHRARVRLFVAFLVFGLLNNVLYVIILSAALDLVPATTPKGIVAFFNIFPALLAKVFWPLISVGQIQYRRRVGFCTAISWSGIVIIALSPSVHARLFGISLASFSSGLGELTFLQLTTTLPTRAASRTALGAWASGTGAAGVAGASIWWLLRGLGVKVGLGLSSFLPLLFPFTYYYVLPPWDALHTTGPAPYQALSTGEDEASTSSDIERAPPSENDALAKPGHPEVYLTPREKLDLLKPLVVRYMLPLCLVYIEEYVINSGIAPTLVFPIPTSGPWSWLFKNPRDYYPFWSLTYQSFVFLSRSSLSLGLPPIPRRYLPVPTITQFFVLVLLFLQARRFIFSTPEYTPPFPEPATGVDRAITFVFLLTCLEGLCGGSAYVNTFYHVGHEGDSGEEVEVEGGANTPEEVKRKMEKEFRIGATGAADSCGILLASLISMPVEISLCNAQVAAGRPTCREL
ncbi:battenin CLN3 protein [Apiotrichum porosum]|uniref:Protein BTN n=1 Tax=Apiotrichum porosum TaxID=105984 RepID=A0A427XE70_9TREE|nr:battenin CLN3 protein [Apiotrichum porosum]RSH77220.1 battenin CLN3 protein [Apiotrichum porosum]